MLKQLLALHVKHQVKEEEAECVGSSGANVKKGKDMATIRPKSPRPAVIKGEKDESIWDKIGTLGRKKRIKEGKYNEF